MLCRARAALGEGISCHTVAFPASWGPSSTPKGLHFQLLPWVSSCILLSITSTVKLPHIT